MKNPAHNKTQRYIAHSVFLRRENPVQEARLKQLFKSKYGISATKVRVDKKKAAHRIGLEYLAIVYNPTVAQLRKGKRTHVNYNDFICG